MELLCFSLGLGIPWSNSWDSKSTVNRQSWRTLVAHSWVSETRSHASDVIGMWTVSLTHSLKQQTFQELDWREHSLGQSLTGGTGLPAEKWEGLNTDKRRAFTRPKRVGNEYGLFWWQWRHWSGRGPWKSSWGHGGVEFGHRNDAVKTSVLGRLILVGIIDGLEGWEGRKFYHLKKQFSYIVQAWYNSEQVVVPSFNAAWHRGPHCRVPQTVVLDCKNCIPRLCAWKIAV